MTTQRLILGFCLLLAFQTAKSQTISSTSAGGAWFDTLTWVGHTIPVWSSNVVINGPVTVQTGYYSECMNLTVSAGASLTGGSIYGDEFKIYGSLANYGTISSDGSLDFRLRLRGNLTNQGSIDIKKLVFDVGNDKYLSSSTSLNIDEITMSDSCDIILSSNITLESSIVTLSFYQHGLHLNGFDFQITSGYYSGKLYGESGRLFLTSNSKLYGATLYGDIDLMGTVIMQAANYFNGDIHVLGTLMNNNDGYSSENYFYGNVINDGEIIQNSGLSWTAYMYGNYTGIGTISIYRMSFNGSKIHEFSSTLPVSVTNLAMGTNDTLILQTNIDIENCNLSFVSNSLLDINGNTLKLKNSILSGKANAGSGILWLSGNSKIQSLSVYEQVYLKGNVQVGDGTVHFYGNVEVMDTMQCVGYYSQESHFHANLYNSGFINDGSSALYMFLYDTLINEGICTPYALYFIGSTLQTLHTILPIAPHVLNVQNQSGITSSSDLLLSASTINGYNNSLFLNSSGLIGDSIILNNLFINSDSGFINLNAGGYVYNCKFYGSIDLLGSFVVYGDNTVFYDETRNYATIKNITSYYSYNLTFTGHLINESIVTGTGLTVTCNSNLTNNGTFNANQLIFAGLGEQTIITSLPIQSNYVSCTDTAGYLKAGSDLLFDQADINLGNEQLFLNGNQLSVYNGFISSGEIFGQNGSVKMNTNSYLHNVDFFTPIALKGTICIYGDQNNFYGTTTVVDTLTRYPSYYGFSAYFYGNLINQGVLTNAGLYVVAYQDVQNHGVWNNYQLSFAGSGNQQISGTQAFSCASVSSTDTAGMITAGSNLLFIGTDISVGNEQLNLAGYELTVQNGSILNSILYGNEGAVNFTLDSYLASTKFYTPVRLKGNVQIYGDAVDFYGDVVIEDSLRNYPTYYSFTVDFYGDVSNFGLVTGSSLVAQLFGDMSNYGIWNNAQTNLTGDADQHISLINNAVLSTQLRWYANVSNATAYTWYRNGLSLAGESENLFLNEQASFLYNNYPVNQSYIGQYQCVTDLGNSRNIFINQETIVFGADLGADISLCTGESQTISPTLVNGLPPYTYLWSNGSTNSNIEVLSTVSGSYALTVTDANQSVATDTITIGVLLPPALDLPADTFACDALMLMIPVFDANFQWSTGSTMNHLLILQSGTYALTVTGSNSCFIEDEILVSIIESPEVYLGPDTILQAGENYLLNAGNSGNSYFWSTGETTASITVSTTDVYSVTLTNGINCTDADEVAVTFLPPASNLELILQDTLMVCEGSFVELLPQPVNGIPPYSYLWSTGSTASFLFVNPLQSSAYSLTVTDGSGSSAIAQSIVLVNQVNEVIITGLTGSCEGQIELLSASGTGSFLWSTGQTASHLFVNQTGNYQVTLTDMHGCTSSDSHEIAFAVNPLVELGNSVESCLGDVVVLQPGISGNYYWSTGATSSYLTVSLSGNYSLTVINSQGCSASDAVEVLFHAVPVVNLGPDLNLLEGSTISLNAGTGFTEYYWSTGASTMSIETSLAGTYFVEVMDSNACWGFDEMVFTTFTNNPDPGWSISNTGVMHTILLPDTCSITIDGVQILAGDYIGVFYTSGSDLLCAGYTIWDGLVNALTVWGDDEITLDKDGFATGESFTFKIWQAATATSWDAEAVYMPLTIMPNQESFAVNGLSGIISLSASSVDYQYINLPQNWSYFSTYIDLFEPNIADLFSPLISSLIIAKNGAGNVYWPQYGLNLIGNCTIGYGYQVKMISPQTLQCEGVAVDPELTPITIPINWSILGYLRNSQASVVSLLAPVISNVVIVKNSAGQTYWPVWNLNTIGNMKPGEGYLIKMISSVIFSYPSNNQSLKVDAVTFSEPYHFKQDLNAETNMILCIPSSVWRNLAFPGDEIAAYTMQNELVGSSVIEEGSTGLAIWQYDENTGIGMNEAEPMHFKVWSARKNTEYTIAFTYQEGSEFYERNGLAVAENMEVITEADNELTWNLYPNPASDQIRLNLSDVESGQLRTCLLDTHGKLIRVLESSATPGNQEIILNVQGLPAGLYFLHITNNLQTRSLPFEVAR